MSENESGSQRAFSWAEEKNAALGNTSEHVNSQWQHSAASYKSVEHYEKSIFTVPTKNQKSPSDSFAWSDVKGKGYSYDYPSDNDYVYSPTYDYSFISQGEKAQQRQNKQNRTQQNQRTNSRQQQQADVRCNAQNRSISQKNTGAVSSSKTAENASSSKKEKRSQTKAKNKVKKQKAQAAAQTRTKTSVQNTKSVHSANTAQNSNYAQKGMNHSQPQRNTRQQPAQNRSASTLYTQQTGSRRTSFAQEEAERRRKEYSEQKKLERNIELNEQKRMQGQSGDDIISETSTKKKLSKKFFAALCVAGVVLFAAIGFAVFCAVYGFPIQTIVIEGAKTYSEEEILEAGNISVGENMLKVLQKKTNDAVSVSLPYIDTVDVDWQLPSTLRLVITETTDKLLIVNGSKYICVDEKGKVISDSKKKVKGNQYKIEGFEEQEYEIGKTFVPNADSGNQTRYEVVNKIIAALDKVGITNCNTITISDLDFITLKCGKNIRIYVNQDMDFETRLALVAAKLTDNPVSSSGTYYLDIRFNNQIVLKDGELK